MKIKNLKNSLTKLIEHSWLPLVIIIISGAFLRFYRLGYHSLWLDEAHSIWITKKPINDMLRYIYVYELHPYFYYFLIHFLQKIGNSEFLLRLPSAVAGVFEIYAVYLLGKETDNHKTGLLAALFVSFSSYEILFSQEIRMYSIQLLFSLLSCFYFLRGLNTKKEKYWYLFSLFSILGVYTDYRTLLILSATFIFFVINNKKYKDKWENFIKSQVIIGFLAVPLLPLALRQTGPSGMGMTHHLTFSRPGFGMFFNSIYSVFAGILINTKIYLIAGFLLIFLITWTFYCIYKEKKYNSLYIFFVLFFSLLILFTVLGSKIYSLRHVVFLSPFFFLVLARSLYFWKDRVSIAPALILVAFLAVNLTSLYMWYFIPRYGTQDFKGAVSYIEKNIKPIDIIVIVPKYQHFPFMYYYKKYNKVIIMSPSNLNEIKDEVKSSKGVWWVFAGDKIQDPKGVIRKWLKNDFIVVSNYKKRNLPYEITGDCIEIYLTKPKN